MPTARELLPRNSLYTLGGILVVLYALGSFFDYQISESLFDPTNPFGVAMAAYGAAPAYFAWAVAGTLLVKARSLARPVVGWLEAAGGGLLVALALAAFMFTPGSYWDGPLIVRIGIGFAAVGGAVWITVNVGRDASRAACLRVAAVLVVVVFAQLILVTAIKVLWERPRMRMIESTPAAEFQPWWSPGYAGRGILEHLGVTAEEFKSFPSGHTANAAVAVSATSLAALRQTVLPRITVIFWTGAAWGFLVAFSRIIVGAHFLTDTVAGFTVTLLVIIFSYRLVFAAGRRNEQLAGQL